MSKKTEIEMMELMAQCETALTDYASRTGADAFANSTSAGAAKAAIKPKLKSQQALAKMAKSLEASRVNSSENIAKLEAKITAKADSIKHHKRQQEALKQEQEQARKADLANKRKALYRTPEPQPEADIQTKAQNELPVDTSIRTSIRHRSFGKGSSNLRRS